MKKILALVVVLAGVLAVAAVWAAPKKAPAMAAMKREAKIMMNDNLKWEPMPGVDGVQVAMISGNMEKGPYEAFVKLKDNQLHPLHTHSFAVKLVVISGQFKYAPEGGPEVTLGPGSFLEIPGHLKHTSGTSDAECVMFQQQTGGWDMKPVAEGAK